MGEIFLYYEMSSIIKIRLCRRSSNVQQKAATGG